jgi:THO complex subunit 2
MLTEMAGIRSDMNFTEIQTQAMGGGPVLQSQTLQQLHDQRHERATQDSSRRLLRSLLGSGIAAPLLIAIAQERQMYPYRESVSDAPLKVLGNNLDKIHQVFSQYLEVLRANLPPKKFDEVIPELAALMSEFGLEASVAFTICRASIHQEMIANDAATKEKAEKNKDEAKAKSKTESQDSAAGNEDVDMADPSKSVTPAEADPSANQDDAEMKEPFQNGDLIASNTSAPTTLLAAPDAPWHPVLNEVMSNLRGALPENFEQTISLPFYVSFWQLSLYDIFVPTSLYEEEQKRQKDHIQEINRDRSDISTEGMKRKNRLREAFNSTFDKLASEMKTHVSTYQATRNRLKKESVEWFKDFPANKIEGLMNTILQECFLPRMLLSSVDALYAYKMLMLIHSTGTPGFRTVKFLDQFFREKQLTALIFHCTSREAENFGRFLNELLKELDRWRSDSSVYVKLAHGIKKDLPGFARKFSQEKRPDGLIDFEDFRRVLYKWHTQLNGAFKACLSSGEYMHIRNAISILKTIRNHFPGVNWIGKAIMECIKGLQKDSREDIKLSANAIMADLTRKADDWITPQAFRLVCIISFSPGTTASLTKYQADPNQVAAKTASRGGSAHPSTPQPSAASSKSLNASAPEFKPGTGPSTRYGSYQHSHTIQR